MNGPQMQQKPGSVWHCPPPHPRATCCRLELSLLLIFALGEAMKRLKGHQGVRDTETNHRAWPVQISSTSCPHTPLPSSAPHVQ